MTTFRTEDGYTDGRHPDHVAFVSRVEADLARRDFTINAMAYDPEEGLVDPFDGRGDSGPGLVRAVGQPERRFEEDGLRILRLYRFGARFGFRLEDETRRAAQNLCGRLGWRFGRADRGRAYGSAGGAPAWRLAGTGSDGG